MSSYSHSLYIPCKFTYFHTFFRNCFTIMFTLQPMLFTLDTLRASQHRPPCTCVIRRVFTANMGCNKCIFQMASISNIRLNDATWETLRAKDRCLLKYFTFLPTPVMTGWVTSTGDSQLSSYSCEWELFAKTKTFWLKLKVNSMGYQSKIFTRKYESRYGSNGLQIYYRNYHHFETKGDFSDLTTLGAPNGEVTWPGRDWARGSGDNLCLGKLSGSCWIPTISWPSAVTRLCWLMRDATFLYFEERADKADSLWPVWEARLRVKWGGV